MKILLLGSNGQVGYELKKSLLSHAHVKFCDRNMVDLLDLDDLNQNSQSKVFVSKEAKSDTSDTTIINKKTPSFNNKIQFVKDQK